MLIGCSFFFVVSSVETTSFVCIRVYFAVLSVSLFYCNDSTIQWMSCMLRLRRVYLLCHCESSGPVVVPKYVLINKIRSFCFSLHFFFASKKKNNKDTDALCSSLRIPTAIVLHSNEMENVRICILCIYRVKRNRTHLLTFGKFNVFIRFYYWIDYWVSHIIWCA